jgi:amidophosphoribosyltransferase
MCGIVGLMGHGAAAPEIYDALIMLQHRGQDAAGILTDDEGMCRKRRARGLVRETFRTRHMQNLRGSAGLGHVRYPTAGSDKNSETQPFFVNSPYGIALAHNGNLTNAHELAGEMRQRDRRYLNTDSDSELLLNVFAHELLRTSRRAMDADAVFRAVRGVHKRCKGAYSVVCMILGFGLVAFRDPYGIRPMVVGRRENSKGPEYLVASESVAMQQLGFELDRDVMPGEAWVFPYGEEAVARQCATRTQYTPCIFEYVYFARPDSLMDRISVHKARLRMGERLVEKIQREHDTSDVDVVIPIPDTSRTSAMEVANRLNVKYREGFIKNRYIGRTFIMPGQDERKRSVRQKLNPINLEFRGKNVLLVDDSIVRGTTSRQIVEMSREAGARKVYFASAAPPVRYQNVYGIDMPVMAELVAFNRSEEDVARTIGADRLFYQSLDGLVDAVQRGNPRLREFDTSCFTGEYVTGGVSSRYLEHIAEHRADAARSARAAAVREMPAPQGEV